MYVCYVVASEMFRPLMWPSSGWQEQEYGHVSGRKISVVIINKITFTHSSASDGISKTISYNDQCSVHWNI